MKRDARPWLFLITVLVILADRISKLWINKHVRMGSDIVIIPKIFRITHVMNMGAAFSMFGSSQSPVLVRWGLVIFSAIAAVIIAVLIVRAGKAWSPAGIGLALILGGALGNLYDRAVLHYVIDFLAVKIVHYDWPDFNVADSCICVGAALLMLELLSPSKTSAQAFKSEA